LIGLAQAVAILPGVSRSGSTISTALLLNVERSEAARFSFLMVVPLIFGKIAKDLLSGSLAEEAISTSALGVGFVAAFVAGFLACKWMIQIVKNARLAYFAIYCLIVGSIAIISQFI
jgi:undecaprenyl-diphosphatase